MAFNFEKLEVWKTSRMLSNQVHELALTFPKVELFSLTSQLKRATDSVNLNIAEGSSGQSKIEFKRFLIISARSSLEVISCLYLALDRKYISQEAFTELYNSYEILYKKINPKKTASTDE